MKTKNRNEILTIFGLLCVPFASFIFTIVSLTYLIKTVRGKVIQNY
jgi:hypothetical protein